MKVVLILLMLLHMVAAFFFEKEFAEITPLNPYALLNRFVELNCTITDDTELNATQLFWQENDGRNATPDVLKIIGLKTLQFKKNITSISEEGTYSCFRNDKIPLELKDGVYTNLRIEYEAVHDVTNISCIVDRNVEEMKCHWNLGEYNHFSDIEVIPVLSVDNGKSSINCTDLNSEKNSCTWKKDQAMIDSSILIFLLIVKNTEFKVTKQQRINYTNKEIWKLTPVKNLTLNGNGTCLTVLWDVPTIALYMDRKAKITLKSKWNGTLEYTTSWNNKTLCNLIPGTSHQVTVQIKPKYGIYYSDPVKITNSTQTMVPLVAPAVFAGSYDEQTTCNSKRDTRNITIYWQKIPEIVQNGIITKHEVSHSAGKVWYVRENSTSAKVDVPCNGQYNITVKVYNKAGPSPGAVIMLPETKKLSPLKRIVVEQDEDSVWIRWFGYQTDTDLYIIWCQGKHANLQCQDSFSCLHFSVEELLQYSQHQCPCGLPGPDQGEINYKLITSTESGANITKDMVGYDDLSELVFGVSQVKGHFGSPIRWQNCQYSKTAEPSVPSFRIAAESPENSITVQWIPPQCQSTIANNVYVDKYRIHYCKMTSDNQCQDEKMEEVIADDSISEYTINNLEGGAKYGIQMEAVAGSRLSGKSDSVFAVPVNNDLSEGSIAGIAIGCVTVFVFALAGIIFIIRNVRNKVNMKYEIKTPDIPKIQLPSGNETFSPEDELPSKDHPSVPLITREYSTDDKISNETIGYSDEKTTKTNKVNGNVVNKTDFPRQLSVDSGTGSLTSDDGHQIKTLATLKEESLQDLIKHQEGYSRVTQHVPVCNCFVIDHHLGPGNYPQEDLTSTDEIEMGGLVSGEIQERELASGISESSENTNAKEMESEFCNEEDPTATDPIFRENKVSFLPFVPESSIFTPEKKDDNTITPGNTEDSQLDYVFSPEMPNNSVKITSENFATFDESESTQDTHKTQEQSKVTSADLMPSPAVEEVCNPSMSDCESAKTMKDIKECTNTNPEILATDKHQNNQVMDNEPEIIKKHQNSKMKDQIVATALDYFEIVPQASDCHANKADLGNQDKVSSEVQKLESLNMPQTSNFDISNQIHTTAEVHRTCTPAEVHNSDVPYVSHTFEEQLTDNQLSSKENKINTSQGLDTLPEKNTFGALPKVPSVLAEKTLEFKTINLDHTSTEEDYAPYLPHTLSEQNTTNTSSEKEDPPILNYTTSEHSPFYPHHTAPEVQDKPNLQHSTPEHNPSNPPHTAPRVQDTPIVQHSIPEYKTSEQLDPSPVNNTIDNLIETQNTSSSPVQSHLHLKPQEDNIEDTDLVNKNMPNQYDTTTEVLNGSAGLSDEPSPEIHHHLSESSGILSGLHNVECSSQPPIIDTKTINGKTSLAYVPDQNGYVFHKCLNL